MDLFTSLIVVCLIGLAYLAVVKSNKIHLMLAGFGAIKNMIQDPKRPTQAHHVCGSVHVLEYFHDGRQYQLYFPIREGIKKNSTNKDVYICIGDVTTSIYQEPGVPYLVTPNDFDEFATVTIFDTFDDTPIAKITGTQQINTS